MTIKAIPLTEIATFVDKAELLREADSGKCAEYAEKLCDKVDMGPLIGGVYKDAEGKEQRMLVDGWNRYNAIVAVNNMTNVTVKFSSYPFEVRTYKTKSDALLDQLRINEEHGLGVTVEDRDAQIRKVVSLKDYTMREIAKQFHLSHASVSRINAGKQKAGKAGPKRGSKKGKGDPKPLVPSAFVRNLRACYLTLRNAQKRADVSTYLWPENKKGEWQDDRVADVLTIRDLVNVLVKFAEEMIKNIESAKEDRKTTKKEKKTAA